MTVTRKDLPELEIEGRRLGRHVLHDDLSWHYQAPKARKIASVNHPLGPNLPLDQGELGSCTGNAAVGMLSTGTFAQRTLERNGGSGLDENDAIDLYSEATHIDRFKGVYPPNDTGSNGLSVCKAAVKHGWLKGYSWAFGVKNVCLALMIQPGITGTEWLSGMDDPDAEGVVHATGSARGGHEYLTCGLVIAHPYETNEEIVADPANLIEFCNSWGEWGLNGRFLMPLPEYDSLLKRQGDWKTGVI